MPLVYKRINTLSEAVPMLGFLFVTEESVTVVDEIDEPGRDCILRWVRAAVPL
jgi:hypothetical protein